MMDQAIADFPKQFTFEPVIEGAEHFRSMNRFVVCGMGGSSMASDLLRVWNPSLPIYTHQDYGLPAFLTDKEKASTLFIMSSYSGNTEEVIESFELAREQDLNMAAVAVGGKLAELSQKYNVPFIRLTDTGIQPRAALGFNIRALIKFMNLQDADKESRALADTLDSSAAGKFGKELSKKLHDRVPVIYASLRNWRIASIWKIKFNETGKIPAFFNVFPEMNHNEMTGFDVQPQSKHFSERFFFIILRSGDDHPQIRRRMDVLAQLYRSRNLPVEILDMEGPTKMHQIFSSLLIGDWAAFYTASHYGLEPELVPMVEEFKKLI